VAVDVDDRPDRLAVGRLGPDRARGVLLEAERAGGRPEGRPEGGGLGRGGRRERPGPLADEVLVGEVAGPPEDLVEGPGQGDVEADAAPVGRRGRPGQLAQELRRARVAAAEVRGQPGEALAEIGRGLDRAAPAARGGRAAALAGGRPGSGLRRERDPARRGRARRLGRVAGRRGGDPEARGRRLDPPPGLAPREGRQDLGGGEGGLEQAGRRVLGVVGPEGVAQASQDLLDVVLRGQGRA